MSTFSATARNTTTAFAASAVAMRDWRVAGVAAADMRGVVKGGAFKIGSTKHTERMENRETNISFIASRAFERGQVQV